MPMFALLLFVIVGGALVLLVDVLGDERQLADRERPDPTWMPEGRRPRCPRS